VRLVRPELVRQAEFQSGCPKGKSVATFTGLRDVKAAREVRRETPEADPF